MATNLATRANGAVATSAPPSLAARMGLTQEQVDLIRNTVAKGATDLELEFFLTNAQRMGLDPLAKQIYFQKRKNRDGSYDITIITGIDGFRSLAERTGKYDGQDEAEFTYDDKGKLLLAKVRVYRKDIGRPFVGVAHWDEYVQTMYSGEVNSMWRKMPRNQLAKCAEALALRKAFPQTMTGVYTHDEMGQANNEARARDESAIEAEVVVPALTDAQNKAADQMDLTPDLPIPTMTQIVQAFKDSGRTGSLKEWLAQNIADLSDGRTKLSPSEKRHAMDLLSKVQPKPEPEPIEEAQIKPQDAPEPVSDAKAAEPETTAPAPKERSAAPILPRYHDLAAKLELSDIEFADLVQSLTERWDNGPDGEMVRTKEGTRDAALLSKDEHAMLKSELESMVAAL